MSEKDVQITYGQGFDALLRVLAGARRPGSWYSSGAIETPMPAIEVAGVGMLSFPVPPSQARQLIASAAERAPYGKGDQTLVDENVRKVWQVSPAKVKISGKGWTTAFRELVQKIGEDLGCESVAVEAQFYKLLVYEKGGFFLAHRDSEKADGMFGTLVVTLPSSHEGGELVIRHDGREAVLDLRCAAPSEIQFAAFYADCEHEVRPLRAGYRVCLIFNLVQTKRKAPLEPPDHRPSIAGAANLLAQWVAGGSPPDKIVHLLDHHYTQAALSFSTLKGADAALAQVLVPAADQAGCVAHLGIVHIEESGSAEHTGGGYHGRRRYSRWDDEEEEPDDEFDVGEVCDGSYYIDQWRAASDAPVDFGEIPIADGEVLPPGALDDEEPDESHFSEATGNEGASFERTYLRAAPVIWPEDRFDRICASAGPDAALARLEQLITYAKHSSGKEQAEAKNGVRQMARSLPPFDEGGWKTTERGSRVTRLLAALNRFGDAELLLETAEPRLVEFYDGSQNETLLDSIPVLGEKRAAGLLAAIARERGPFLPGPIIALWILLARHKASSISRPLLARLLEAVLDALARHTPPVLPAGFGWSRYGQVDLDEDEEPGAPESLSPAMLNVFLETLHASPCAAQMPEAIRAIIGSPALFTPEKILLPAIEETALPVGDAPAALWAHCARHYLQRSELPPEPPRDWAQKCTLSGKSPLLRELETFARDPQAQVHRFRVRKELRQEIHRAIDGARLDMTHVTERGGSPQTLVCTKTRATHERARKQYRSDLSDMRRLLALPLASAKGCDPLAQRLRSATAAH